MALVAVGNALVVGVVLMSDRAPGLLDRISRRIDTGSSRAAQLASQARPQSDFEIHIVLWAVVTVLVGLTMWSNGSVLASAILVLTASVVIERAQEAFTLYREMQVGDLVANTIGVLTGLGLVTGLAIVMGWQDGYPEPPPS